MSTVAEFARQLHMSEPAAPASEPVPIDYPGKVEQLFDVQAVIFDVYGTLVNYRKASFEDSESTVESLKRAFSRVVERFGMGPYLKEMNPASPPEATLHDFYHGLIALDHEKSRRDDIETPEVSIERIWGLVLMMLKRRGYDAVGLGLGEDSDVAKCMAYAYNFWALGRGFYSGVVDALLTLKKHNIKIGLLSNAQFYTPIDLTLFAREQSGDAIDDCDELFDRELCFYSYEYGIAKPGLFLFKKLFNVLYEEHILPSQTVFVGNDLLADIRPAQEIGLQTAFFCGDYRTAFVHNVGGDVVPDLSFSSYDELPMYLSFYEEKEQA